MTDEERDERIARSIHDEECDAMRERVASHWAEEPEETQP